MGQNFEQKPEFLWTLLVFRTVTVSLSCWLCYAAAKLIYQLRCQKQQKRVRGSRTSSSRRSSGNLKSRSDRKPSNIDRTLILTLLCIIFFTLTQIIALVFSIGLITELYQNNKSSSSENSSIDDNKSDDPTANRKKWITTIGSLMPVPALIGFDFLLIVCVDRLILTFDSTQYQVNDNTIRIVYLGLSVVVGGQVIGMLISEANVIFRGATIPLFVGLVAISLVLYLTILVWIVRRFYQTTCEIAHSISTVLPMINHGTDKQSGSSEECTRKSADTLSVNDSDNDTTITGMINLNVSPDPDIANASLQELTVLPNADGSTPTSIHTPRIITFPIINDDNNNNGAKQRTLIHSSSHIADSLLDAALRVSLCVILPLISSILHSILWLAAVSVCYQCSALPPFLAMTDLLFNSYCMLCTFKSARKKYYDPVFGRLHQWLLKKAMHRDRIPQSLPQLSSLATQSN